MDPNLLAGRTLRAPRAFRIWRAGQVADRQFSKELVLRFYFSAILLVALPLRAELTVSTDFPGGSGTVAAIDQDQAVIRLDPTDHPDRGWRCWWYVGIDGLTPDQPLTLDVGEAPWATPNQAAFSVDGGRTWQHTPAGVREGKRIRYELCCPGTSALVAWGPPFLPADASRLVQRIAEQSPCAEAFSLCRTREGRETPAVRVTADGAQQRRPLIWIQARQHAWETGIQLDRQRLCGMDRLRSTRSQAAARNLRDRCRSHHGHRQCPAWRGRQEPAAAGP